jgi:hypothetical protein
MSLPGGNPERGVWIEDPAGRHDLVVFAERARVLDEAAVIRLRTRAADGLLGAWVGTGFDVLAGRAVAGRIQPADLTCAAEELARGLRAADAGGYVDPGYPLDSAWRGALPAETGFVHVDDVPAAVLADLAARGAELARESAGHGPPASLLDSEVLHVSGAGAEIGVPMRCVLAMAAMRFLPEDPPDAEVVRIRASPAWLRIDARFGSVFRRRVGLDLLVR